MVHLHVMHGIMHDGEVISSMCLLVDSYVICKTTEQILIKFCITCVH